MCVNVLCACFVCSSMCTSYIQLWVYRICVQFHVCISHVHRSFHTQYHVYSLQAQYSVYTVIYTVLRVEILYKGPRTQDLYIVQHIQVMYTMSRIQVKHTIVCAHVQIKGTCAPSLMCTSYTQITMCTCSVETMCTSHDQYHMYMLCTQFRVYPLHLCPSCVVS
ncbi:hypothetical protein NP493_1228g00074 [Ridgeia piscesae]|uniref:Uncharacterized protein n=1 Tax=Ridgeia piscesae TaxID=27915 RepID=A0AAD9NFL8_RIDPI|nr:hypothetical protein NP493_1228g00074 [Ridgeia piscesae]